MAHGRLLAKSHPDLQVARDLFFGRVCGINSKRVSCSAHRSAGEGDFDWVSQMGETKCRRTGSRRRRAGTEGGLHRVHHGQHLSAATINKNTGIEDGAERNWGYTKTCIIVTYIEGLVEPSLVTEVNSRLSRIEIDGILESGYIEELIEDQPSSPFPQILSTERPDVVCGNLLEGRIAILVDGTPFVLIAPTTLFSLLQSSEDYYQRSLASTAIRWLRYFFTAMSFVLPSLYVALITYHHEMVPTSLLISMASSREAVPFPALVEAMIMEVTFEALREAGVRLPKQVGAAVSIVGALVIGQAAVQAGLVSAPMVIVVAITGIASFMIPHYIAGISIRLLRFPMMLLAGTLGLLGIMLGVIMAVVHLCSLRSLGVPYLSPVGPLRVQELKDTLVRAPWWMMDTRPKLLGEANPHRQAPGMKPGPTNGGDAT